ncbi:Crp/Fnr family transcriptional regulator [Hymenobacter rubripertinctus]|uniref:Crp/Fnr family transcriptional regulator n=1 Tax=Hymenobacter rubripertinctus TaxID=2029981 RepID=A0A418R8K5_9BACT|nr:Crp/Fnr family transcriptional regulator [Hymenobacter rubripertinctus]RIY13813.1 Crp/Fnr family transcriptional regulator [Hymenobacter rubripertinctus]
MEAFLAVCRAIHPLSEGLEAELRRLARLETVPARTALLEPGSVAQRLYFLETGLVRGFYLKDGKEVTSWFMPEGHFVISILSFFSRQPSHEYLQTLAECRLWSLTHAQVQGLYRQFAEFNCIGRVLTERYYVLSEQRALDLRMLPAAERYARLLRDFPGLVQQVPLHLLASHLGITAETLSRLRARRAG